jgi:hypothetical protein
VLLLAEEALAVLLVLLVVAVVEEDETVLLLEVMTVGRTGKLLVEAVTLLVLLESVAAVVRVTTPSVVGGAGTGTGPGISSAGAGVAGVEVAKGAGSAACRFHHNGLVLSSFN